VVVEKVRSERNRNYHKPWRFSARIFLHERTRPSLLAQPPTTTPSFDRARLRLTCIDLSILTAKRGTTRLPLRSIDQPGVQWVEGDYPEWTKEPSVEVMSKLARHHLALEEEPDVAFFAEGALNKLFAFDCTKGRFLIRFAFPVAPCAKTDSEFTITATICRQTIIPVPRTFAFALNLENELGFEWMIMERIDVQPLDEFLHEVS
jgi:hypothetical protein